MYISIWVATTVSINLEMKAEFDTALTFLSNDTHTKTIKSTLHNIYVYLNRPGENV